MKYEVQPGYNVATKERKEPFFPGEKLELDDAEGKRLSDLGIVKEADGDDSGAGNPLNATETIKLILVASLDQLTTFKEGETRKGVLEAIAKREKQLETSNIEIVDKLASLEDVEALLADETRPAVREALEKRRSELQQ